MDFHRGEVILASVGAPHGKPRPYVVVQTADAGDRERVTVCPLTSETTATNPYRLLVRQTKANGLQRDSLAMADNIVTIRERSISRKIGQLEPETLDRLGLALCRWLSLHCP
jgi:mRNA interferase MazF